MADDEQAIVLARTSLVIFMVLHTQILFVPLNEIKYVNVYSNKLVNNLHINFIRIIQQTSCVSSQSIVVSSVSGRAVRQARHRQNAWARHVERVASRVVSRGDEPSVNRAILSAGRNAACVLIVDG